MSRYVLDHHLEGEKKRLALMSQLLDPMHRRQIESLGISREARVLDVGCGNGSMSAWMAEHIAPTDRSSRWISTSRLSITCVLRALSSVKATSLRGRSIPMVSISSLHAPFFITWQMPRRRLAISSRASGRGGNSAD